MLFFLNDLSGRTFQAIRSNDDYVNAMAQHEDKLVVIKFYDQFCRACDEIRPRFEELSRSLPEEEAMFYELEVGARVCLISFSNELPDLVRIMVLGLACAASDDCGAPDCSDGT